MMPHEEEYPALHPKAREALESHRRRNRLARRIDNAIMVALGALALIIIGSWLT